MLGLDFITAALGLVTYGEAVRKSNDTHDLIKNYREAKITNALKYDVLEADGSSFKLTNKLIVEPLVLITESMWNDQNNLKNILNLVADMFAAQYIRTFKVLVSFYAEAPFSAVRLLGTEDDIRMTKNMGLEDDYLHKLINGYIGIEDEDNEFIKNFDKYNPLERSGGGILPTPKYLEKSITVKERNMFDPKNPTSLGAIYERHIDLTFEHTNISIPENFPRDNVPYMAKYSEDDLDNMTPEKREKAVHENIEHKQKFLEKKYGKNSKMISDHTTKSSITIPITIRLNLKQAPINELSNGLSPANRDKSFRYRWDSLAAGLISFKNFIMADDLMTEYKDNKLKDRAQIIKTLKDIEISANKKLLSSSKAVGFNLYYSTLICSTDDLKLLEKTVIGGSITNNAHKESLCKALKAMFIIPVNLDREKIEIYTKDTSGVSTVFLSELNRRGSNKNDLSDVLGMVQALATKTPIAL